MKISLVFFVIFFSVIITPVYAANGDAAESGDTMEYWSLIAANVAIAIGLGFEFYKRRDERKQAKNDSKRQEEAIKRQEDDIKRQEEQLKLMRQRFVKTSYDAIRKDHTSLLRLVIEKPEFTEAWKKNEKYRVDWYEFTRDEMVLHFFYCLCFDLFERIYADHIQNRLRLSEEESKEEWEYWKRWFIDLSENWMFWWTYYEIKKYLDKRFTEEIENIVKKPDFVDEMVSKLPQRPVS